MEPIKMYTNTDVAKMLNCSKEAVQKFAQKNSINFIGNGRRKIYIWFDDNIELFKNRDSTPGRKTK